MPSAVALETLTSSSAISTCRPSGHFNVGHHDINAVPFGVSVSEYVTLVVVHQDPASHRYFLRGSSFGSTYVISKGPIPEMTICVAPLALTKCVIFCGIDA